MEELDLKAEEIHNYIINQFGKLRVKFNHGGKEIQENTIISSIGNNANLIVSTSYVGG